MSTLATSSSRPHSKPETRTELGVTAVMLPELDFDEQISLCTSLGVRYYQYRPREIGSRHRSEDFSSHGNHRFDLTPLRLIRDGAGLSRQLRQGGLECWGTLPAIDASMTDSELQPHFDGALAANAGRIACSPPPYPVGPFDYTEFLHRTLDRYRQIVEHLARPAKLKLLIETHREGLASSPGLAWNLCRHFDPRHVGVIFDLANFAIEGMLEPNLAVSVLAPYIDCVHIGGARRVPAGLDESGATRWRTEFCAMHESALHLPTWLNALRQSGVRAPLIIEDFRYGVTGAQKLREDVLFLNSANAEFPPA